MFRYLHLYLRDLTVIHLAVHHRRFSLLRKHKLSNKQLLPSRLPKLKMVLLPLNNRKLRRRTVCLELLAQLQYKMPLRPWSLWSVLWEICVYRMAQLLSSSNKEVEELDVAEVAEEEVSSKNGMTSVCRTRTSISKVQMRGSIRLR